MVMATIKIMKGVCHAEDKDICSSIVTGEKKRENTDKVVMAVYRSFNGITIFKGTVSSILHKPTA